jgi:hypothetical protein
VLPPIPNRCSAGRGYYPVMALCISNKAVYFGERTSKPVLKLANYRAQFGCIYSHFY